jgi:hypothetical protein
MAHIRSTQCSVLRSVAFIDHLVVEQLGQSDCHRTGENVTAMLCNVGLSARCRTGASVSTRTLGTSCMAQLYLGSADLCIADG